MLRQLVHVVTTLPLRSCPLNITKIKTVPFAILCHVPGSFCLHRKSTWELGSVGFSVY